MSGYLSQVILMVVLVALSAFFSSTETAFSSLNRTRLKNMADHGDRRAEATLALAERYDELLSTILVGNNVVNIALSSIATLFFVGLIGNAGVGLSTAVITVVVLIFGEISPKSLAKESPERFAMLVTPVIRVLVSLLKPINWLFTQWKKLLRKIVKTEEEPAFTSNELMTIVEEAEQEGGMNAEESELLKSAIEFHDLDVGDILTPRVRVEGIEAGAAPSEVADQFEQSGYSRLPVYEETLDHIVGVIHQKDFYNRMRKGTAFHLSDIMKKPVYVPASAKISDTLRLLQKTQSQLAVVADEYGGTEGIITMEDILEELVGEIWDEHDEVEEPFRFSENGRTCTVLGSADPEELFEKLGIEDHTEASTVSGWVMEKTEKIPQAGDSFELDGWKATVLKADERHVQEIQLNQAG
ncbi:MAG: hemolysin family protein [Clostridia bacterium]|nr:hemolysin family protein [Clostridia bacterium]MDD6039994.1 hemolysin family protein [Clostridia bacterium]